MQTKNLFKTKKAIVKVDTEEMYGKTQFIFTKKGHINYVYKINKKKMHECFYRAIRKLDDLKLKK